MGLLSTKDSLPYPILGDTRDVPRDFLALVNALDGKGIYVCTSSTRPTGSARFVSRLIYETDTKAYGWYDGTAWRMFDTNIQTYTPVWRANGSTSGLAVGSGGSLTGKYVRCGPLCWVRIELVIGSSGFNGGAGSYDFSLPFTTTAATDSLRTKTWAPNAGGNFSGFAIANAAATVVTPYSKASSSSSAEAPMQNANTAGTNSTGVPLASGNYTWTTQGNISIEGEYPI